MPASRPTGPKAALRALGPHVVPAAVAALPVAAFVAGLASGLSELTHHAGSAQTAVAPPAVHVEPPTPIRRRAPASPVPFAPELDPTTALLWEVHERFCAPLAAAACGIPEACCTRPEADCVDEAFAACTAQIELSFRGIDLAPYRYDPELAAECLASVEAARARCELPDALAQLHGTCPVPLVRGPPGAPCAIGGRLRCDDAGDCTYEECSIRYAAGEPSLAGVCRAGLVEDVERICRRPARSGESCLSIECEPGLRCDDDDRCVRLGSLGASCDGHDACGPGLLCLGDRCTDGPRWCAEDHECGNRLNCIREGEPRRHCEPRRGRAGTRYCHRAGLCAVGEICVTERDGICEPTACDRGEAVEALGGPAGERIAVPE